MTYGTQNAPYLAIRVLRQLAEDIKDIYPRVSEIILNDFYMDDMTRYHVFDTEAEAKKCIMNSRKHKDIRFASMIQNPNEYIVSLSGGYHCGFNSGWNEAESINFGSERWIKLFPDFEPCECKDERTSNMKMVKEILSNTCQSDMEKLKKKGKIRF